MEQRMEELAKQVVTLRNKINKSTKAIDKLREKLNNFKLKDKYPITSKYHNTTTDNNDVVIAFTHAHTTLLKVRIVVMESDIAGWTADLSKIDNTRHNILHNTDLDHDTTQHINASRDSLFASYGKQAEAASKFLATEELKRVVAAQLKYENTLVSLQRANLAKQEKAKKEEMDKKERALKAMKVDNQQPHAALIKRIEQLEKLRTNTTSTHKNNNNTSDRCHRCSSPKHTVKECPKKAGDVTCTKCKKKGHVAVTCSSNNGTTRTPHEHKNKKKKDNVKCGNCGKNGHTAALCRQDDTQSVKSNASKFSTSSKKSTTSSKSTSSHKRKTSGPSSKNQRATRVGRVAQP